MDKYGQVFEGRAGGITKDVLGSHTGGFNKDVWGVSMIGDFETTPPDDIMVRTVGRLLGWRMGLDHVNPLGTVQLTSAGGEYTFFPGRCDADTADDLRPPRCRQHRMPGNAGYAAIPAIRDIAARFKRPPDLVDSLRGGAIFDRWDAMGGKDSPLGAPTSPEAAGDGDTGMPPSNTARCTGPRPAGHNP